MQLGDKIHFSLLHSLIIKSVLLLTLTSVLKQLVQNNSLQQFYQKKLSNTYAPIKDDDLNEHQIMYEVKSHTELLKLEYFQLLQFEELQKGAKNTDQYQKCLESEFQSDKKNSVLFITTDNKKVGLKFTNFIRELKIVKQQMINPDLLHPNKCVNINIYILKPKKLLQILDQSMLDIHMIQIQKAIQKIVNSSKNVNIMSYEVGCALLFQYFKNLSPNIKTFSTLAKIDKILMLDPLSSQAQVILGQSIKAFWLNIKAQISIDKAKLQIFNSIQFVIISSTSFQAKLKYMIYEVHNKDLQLQNNTNESIKKAPENTNQKYNMQSLIFNQTIIIQTSQIYMIHRHFERLEYFGFKPFVKILARFFLFNNKKNLDSKAIEYFFRYGETQQFYPVTQNNKVYMSECIQYTLQTVRQPIIWKIKQDCFKLRVTSQFEDPVFIIYSESQKTLESRIVTIYNQQFVRIQPQSQDQKGNQIFIFDKSIENLIVFNPCVLNINVCASKVFSPKYPLTTFFSNFQILYSGRQTNNTAEKPKPKGKPSVIEQKSLFVIRECSGQYKIFPDQLKLGKLQRSHLLERSSNKCYSLNEKQHAFASTFQIMYENWTLCRNIVIFSLVVVFILKSQLIDVFFTLLIINYVMNYDRQIPVYIHLVLISLAKAIQILINFTIFLCSFIQIDKKRIFYCLIIVLLVSYLTEAFAFNAYNYWKILAVFLIFFFNPQNAFIIVFKVYFCFDQLVYDINNFKQIIQLTLFIQATSKDKNQSQQAEHACQQELQSNQQFQDKQKKLKLVERIIKYLFLLGMTTHLSIWGEDTSADVIITLYMRVIIVVRFIQNYLL